MDYPDTQTSDVLPHIDLVGEAIKEMRIRTASTGALSRDGSWAFPSSDPDTPVAYFLVRGRADVAFEEGATEQLEAGDLLVVTRAWRHRLRGHDSASPPGQACFLFATIEAELTADCPFGSTLPDYFLFRSGERTESPYLEAQLQCLAWEARSSAAASAMMQARLWEIIFMHALRMHLARTKVTRGWLAALCDRQLSRVLNAIHAAPERNWTVEKLAAEAAMSRATLARRFAATLDDTPMDYLYRLRMRIAATLLKEPGSSISAIAERVGYSSESAFSSAFHRRFGTWPGGYRATEAARQ